MGDDPFLLWNWPIFRGLLLLVLGMGTPSSHNHGSVETGCIWKVTTIVGAHFSPSHDSTRWAGLLLVTYKWSYNPYPPWNKQIAPENQWLEDEFSFGARPPDRCYVFVSFREGITCITRWWFETFFIFIPIWRRFPILTNIFQMGWITETTN